MAVRTSTSLSASSLVVSPESCPLPLHQVRGRWNTRGSKLLATAGSDPQVSRNAEDQECKRWTTSLAECLEELNLPRSRLALESRDPMKFLERAASKTSIQDYKVAAPDLHQVSMLAQSGKRCQFSGQHCAGHRLCGGTFRRTLPEDGSAICA